jgi:hypothetical protein
MFAYDPRRTQGYRIMDSVPIHAIAQVIQLAVAPVFMLTGIAGFLSVLSHRLS